jgi:ectoine hydroxylase-related dioxygenase (phytanoyl-CoA dioxygenase family)
MPSLLPLIAECEQCLSPDKQSYDKERLEQLLHQVGVHLRIRAAEVIDASNHSIAEIKDAFEVVEYP